MKNYIGIFVVLFFTLSANAQTDTKRINALLQECLSLNANTAGAKLNIYENTGMAEYTHNGAQQRIKLADLAQVAVNQNNAGYSVDLSCGSEGACVNFIKNDTSSTYFQSTAIQFVEAVLANTFAENISTLVTLYKNNESTLEKKFYKNESGKIPMLAAKQNTPIAKVNTPKEQDNNEDDDEEKVKPEKKQISQKRKETEEIDNEEKKEVIKSNRRAKKEVKEEEEEDSDEKKISRSKRRMKSDEEQDNEPETNAKRKPTRNSIIEDVDDEKGSGEKDKMDNGFCTNLMAVLQSGKENDFSSIEGKLTNPESKINESKVKLKGARKNYLSWYKKQRAFIAELKSGNDYELIFKEYEKIQTTLDECLGSGWEMEDLSNSEEYAKLKTEVKDVQFKKEDDEKMPAIRVIFIESDNKFTLFLRVR